MDSKLSFERPEGPQRFLQGLLMGSGRLSVGAQILCCLHLGTN